MAACPFLRTCSCQHELASPFLSATLKTRIAPVAAAIDALQVGLLSAALVSFYQKVFEDQEVYDVEVRILRHLIVLVFWVFTKNVRREEEKNMSMVRASQK